MVLSCQIKHTGVLKVVDVCDAMSVDVSMYDRVLFRVLNHLAHCIYDPF